MCFAFQIEANFQQVAEYFELKGEPLSPFGTKLFAKSATLSILPGREPEVLSWGFSHPTLKKQVINARVETVDTNPLFRSSFKKNRCLIPATGFLEWGTDKRKYLIQLAEPLFAFAGIYRAGEVTMVTCTPNSFMSTIHDRMPVILSPTHYDPWLLEGGKEWLVPYQGEMRSTCLAEPASRKSLRTPQDVQGELF